MLNVSYDLMRQRFAIIEQQRRQYEWQLKQSGRLKQHEVWRYDYLVHPYLMGAPDDRIGERFQHIFMNLMELSPEGKICIDPQKVTGEFIQVFTHLLEEYASRGNGPSEKTVKQAGTPFLKYYKTGEPIGTRMFKGFEPPKNPVVVKYGKRQFLEPMLKNGDLRLANARFYSGTELNDAIRDDETSRTFFIPTYKERIAGQNHLNIQGKQINFNNDDIVIPLEFDDYYLFSLCEEIHYRMPTDFDADAAIIIRDPILFKKRLISTFLARFPDWTPMYGKVTYYDPYRDYTKFKTPEMAKHFGYTYQKEVRFVFKPCRKIFTELEPLFLSLGSMTDYAEMVTL